MTKEELEQKAMQGNVEEVICCEIIDGNISDDDINNYLELLGENAKAKLEKIFKDAADELVGEEEQIELLVKAGYDRNDQFIEYIENDVIYWSIETAEEFCVTLSDAYIEGTLGLQKNNEKAWLVLETLMKFTGFYSGDYRNGATGIVIEAMIINYLNGFFNKFQLEQAIKTINIYYDLYSKEHSPLVTLFHILKEINDDDIEKLQYSEETWEEAWKNYENKVSKDDDSDAYYDLGFCYEEGLGTNINKKQAFEWYKKAAEEGSLYAQYRVAQFYINDINKERNPQKGLEILEKLSEDNDLFALRYLGFIYYKGIGVEQHQTKAKEYFKKAVEQGDEISKNYLNEFDKAHQNYIKAEDRNANQSSSSSGNNSGCLGMLLALIAFSSSFLFAICAFVL